MYKNMPHKSMPSIGVSSTLYKKFKSKRFNNDLIIDTAQLAAALCYSYYNNRNCIFRKVYNAINIIFYESTSEL